jgi:hypothetical protein
VIDGYLLTPSRTGALELGGELVVDIEVFDALTPH